MKRGRTRIKAWLTAFKIGFALAALLGVVRSASAQFPAATGVSAWVEPGLAGSGVRAIPTLAFDGPHTSVVGAALLAGAEREIPFQGFKLVGAVLLGPSALVPLELRIAAAHRDGAAIPALGFLRTEARLHFQDGRRGAWMGAASEQTQGGSRDAGDWGSPFVGFGAWAKQHRMTLLLDLEQRAGLLPAPATPAPDSDSIPQDRSNVGAAEDDYTRVTLTTTRATVRWEGERLELESVAGVTLSLLRSPRRWAQARAALRISPDLAVFATVGSRAPELYLIEPTQSPSATVGLRFLHWRSTDMERTLVARASAFDWRVRSLGGGEYALAVRAPGARLVEVMGDFTDWRPLRLARAGSERWECVVTLAPGIHHVNLRVDGGEWMAPPGAPTAADSYNGTVGIVVAE